MTVKELIAKLAAMPQDAEVRFAYNYGDRARTLVAPEVRRVREEPVAYSEYHSEWKILGGDDEYERAEAEGATREAVVLS